MGVFLELLKQPPRALWLDCHAYCARLLADGTAPWLDIPACVAWQRKAQGLLKPSVTALPLVPAIEAWLAAHPGLREAMRARPRINYPIKTLLADTPLRGHLVELARGLRTAVPGSPLALVLPTPRAWLAGAWAQAHGAPPAEVAEEEADIASVYVADFLRAFADAGVDALLLEESAAEAPASVAASGCQSVLNLAAHYRWDVGLQLAHASPVPAGCAFAVAPRALAGTPTGVVLAEAFWDGGALPAGAAFHYLHIPSGAQPEGVLQRLAMLR